MEALCFDARLVCFLRSSSCRSLPTLRPCYLLHPALSKDQIAFRHADDIWVVARTGGEAVRLTSAASVVDGPFFSPDGQTIAYSARIHGNLDVYTIPANGGVPHRLTYHPGDDSVVGWSPDGKDILFLSGRAAWNDFSQLFRIHADGSALPVAVPASIGRQRLAFTRRKADRLRKGSADVDTMLPPGATLYSRICGATLARAHARWGDRIAIASYLGKSDAFDRAIADFSAAYADQNERDYAAFRAAVDWPG